MRNTRIEVRPIAGTIGAEIHGVDISKDLDKETVADIRQALLDFPFHPPPRIIGMPCATAQ